MIAQISDLGDLPDDLEIFYDDGCFYFRIGLAESEDGLWFTSIDIGYVESTGRSPWSQVKPIDFAMFGFEITVTDQKDNISYTTMDPLEARWCIPEVMRPLVVAIACEGYLRLIRIFEPEYIFRFT
jgi:hypothetical protein